MVRVNRLFKPFLPVLRLVRQALIRLSMRVCASSRQQTAHTRAEAIGNQLLVDQLRYIEQRWEAEVGSLGHDVSPAGEGGRQGFRRSPVPPTAVAAPEKHALPNSEAPLIFLKVNYAEKVIEVWGRQKSLCYVPFSRWMQIADEIGHLSKKAGE